MKPANEHHYGRVNVQDISLLEYWQNQEKAASIALSVARRQLAGLAFKGQLALNFEPEQLALGPTYVVPLRPDHPNIVA